MPRIFFSDNSSCHRTAKKEKKATRRSKRVGQASSTSGIKLPSRKSSLKSSRKSTLSSLIGLGKKVSPQRSAAKKSSTTGSRYKNKNAGEGEEKAHKLSGKAAASQGGKVNHARQSHQNTSSAPSSDPVIERQAHGEDRNRVGVHRGRLKSAPPIAVLPSVLSASAGQSEKKKNNNNNNNNKNSIDEDSDIGNDTALDDPKKKKGGGIDDDDGVINCFSDYNITPPSSSDVVSSPFSFNFGQPNHVMNVVASQSDKINKVQEVHPVFGYNGYEARAKARAQALKEKRERVAETARRALETQKRVQQEAERQERIAQRERVAETARRALETQKRVQQEAERQERIAQDNERRAQRAAFGYTNDASVSKARGTASSTRKKILKKKKNPTVSTVSPSEYLNRNKDLKHPYDPRVAEESDSVSKARGTAKKNPILKKKNISATPASHPAVSSPFPDVDLTSDLLATPPGIKTNGLDTSLSTPMRTLSGDDAPGPSEYAGTGLDTSLSTPMRTLSGDDANVLSPHLSQIRIGSRVDIYWKEDEQFYPGTVMYFVGPNEEKCFVLYDDGETEVTDMSTEIFRWLSDDDNTNRNGNDDDDDDIIEEDSKMHNNLSSKDHDNQATKPHLEEDSDVSDIQGGLDSLSIATGKNDIKDQINILQAKQKVVGDNKHNHARELAEKKTHANTLRQELDESMNGRRTRTTIGLTAEKKLELDKAIEDVDSLSAVDNTAASFDDSVLEEEIADLKNQLAELKKSDDTVLSKEKAESTALLPAAPKRTSLQRKVLHDHADRVQLVIEKNPAYIYKNNEAYLKCNKNCDGDDPLTFFIPMNSALQGVGDFEPKNYTVRGHHKLDSLNEARRLETIGTTTLHFLRDHTGCFNKVTISGGEELVANIILSLKKDNAILHLIDRALEEDEPESSDERTLSSIGETIATGTTFGDFAVEIIGSPSSPDDMSYGSTKEANNVPVANSALAIEAEQRGTVSHLARPMEGLKARPKEELKAHQKARQLARPNASRLPTTELKQPSAPSYSSSNSEYENDLKEAIRYSLDDQESQNITTLEQLQEDMSVVSIQDKKEDIMAMETPTHKRSDALGNSKVCGGWCEGEGNKCEMIGGSKYLNRGCFFEQDVTVPKHPCTRKCGRYLHSSLCSAIEEAMENKEKWLCIACSEHENDLKEAIRYSLDNQEIQNITTLEQLQEDMSVTSLQDEKEDTMALETFQEDMSVVTSPLDTKEDDTVLCTTLKNLRREDNMSVTRTTLHENLLHQQPQQPQQQAIVSTRNEQGKGLPAGFNHQPEDEFEFSIGPGTLEWAKKSLNLDPSQSYDIDKLKRAYNQRLFKTHPDKNTNASAADLEKLGEEFRNARAAWGIIQRETMNKKIKRTIFTTPRYTTTPCDTQYANDLKRNIENFNDLGSFLEELKRIISIRTAMLEDHLAEQRTMLLEADVTAHSAEQRTMFLAHFAKVAPDQTTRLAFLMQERFEEDHRLSRRSEGDRAEIAALIINAKMPALIDPGSTTTQKHRMEPLAEPLAEPIAEPSASPSGGPSASPSASPSGGPSASPSRKRRRRNDLEINMNNTGVGTINTRLRSGRRSSSN